MRMACGALLGHMHTIAYLLPDMLCPPAVDEGGLLRRARRKAQFEHRGRIAPHTPSSLNDPRENKASSLGCPPLGGMIGLPL